jgi:hypothetical protein
MTTSELPLLCRNQLHPLSDRNSKGECKGCEDQSRFAREESKVERMKRLLSEAKPPAPGWQARALCGGADPTDWLLLDARGTASHQIERKNRERHMRAKKVCDACPVRVSCLGFALLGEVQQFGTWGAELLTASDWEAARQARKELAGE